MIPTERIDGGLHIEEVCLQSLAETVGTPAYVYSHSHIQTQFAKLSNAFAAIPHRLCYSVKANSNLTILGVFRRLGASFDVVSGGELARVLAAGGDPSDVVFSGVGKRTDEIDYALKLGILCFNVESESELLRLSERARLLETPANVAVRVNPNIDARTHPYISTGLKENKFGVPIEHAADLYRRIVDDPFLKATGIDCHIGSALTEDTPLLDALDALLELRRELDEMGIAVHHLDLGGGMGVPYQNEPEFDVSGYGAAVRQRLAGVGADDLEVWLEPGRFLVAGAGVLLTRIEYLKTYGAADAKQFAVVDASMSELIRPALYTAYHEVQPVAARNADDGYHSHLGRGWSCMRVCGLSRQRPDADIGRRRPPGHRWRRCLRHGSGFQLQYPPTTCGGARCRRASPGHPAP